MNKEQLEEYYREVIPQKPTETTQEDIKRALEDVKNDVGIGVDTKKEVQEQYPADSEDDTDGVFGDAPIVRRESCDIPEKRSVTQDDLLVERSNVNTIMDEYVDYEEV